MELGTAQRRSWCDQDRSVEGREPGSPRLEGVDRVQAHRRRLRPANARTGAGRLRRRALDRRVAERRLGLRGLRGDGPDGSRPDGRGAVYRRGRSISSAEISTRRACRASATRWRAGVPLVRSDMPQREFGAGRLAVGSTTRGRPGRLLAGSTGERTFSSNAASVRTTRQLLRARFAARTRRATPTASARPRADAVVLDLGFDVDLAVVGDADPRASRLGELERLRLRPPSPGGTIKELRRSAA
jgi:hypothetical protein